MTFLIVDQGGHASRTVIMDRTGTPVASSERPLATFRPQGAWVEHDPLELLETIRDTMEETVLKAVEGSDILVAAGFATQRSNVVCWDGLTGQALSPVISWQDTRAGNRISTLSSRAEDLHSKTGLFLSAHYGASKIQWCLENIPEVKKAKKRGRLRTGPMSSFLAWQLTRERPFVTDPVSASRTLLFNIWERKWDRELQDLFGVPEEVLPVCVPSVYEYGNLEIGKVRVPLTLVTGDQAAALFAHGRLKTDTAYVNMGTGAFVSRFTGHTPVLSQVLLTSVTHVQNGMGEYVLEGTVNGAGSALAWVQDTYRIKDLRMQLPLWFKEIVDPPLFLNGISGLGSPFWIPDFPSEFVGKGGPAAKAVAVAESIAFLLYRNILEMDHHVKKPERIQITGGLSALDGVCQLLADLTGVPAYRPVQTEATARGTCFLLAGRPDQWPEAAEGTWFEPVEGTSGAQRYGRWSEAMGKRIRGGR